MAYFRGPNIVKDGLVLALDAGNIKSFRGEPAVNILTTISYTYGTLNDTFFKTNYGSEIVDIPKIGNRTVHYVNIFNDYNGGSGSCCPAPFSFGDFTVSPSTTYTYQIIFKTSTGYNHPNYMYHYQFNSGTYITEFGLFSTSRVEELGDGWKHGWGTFTTNASTNRIISYLFHYEYGIWNKIQVAGIMLSQRSIPLDPKFIMPPATSRGTTVATGGGLIDQSGNNNNGELINGVGYNSDNLGSLVFDGVDDEISITNNGSFDYSGDFAVCVWIYPTAYDGTYQTIIDTYPGGVTNGWIFTTMNSSSQLISWYTQASNWQQSSSGVTLNAWNCLVATRIGTTVKLYKNDTEIASFSDSSNIRGGILRIGRGLNASYGDIIGRISNVVIYKNKGLTPEEVQQNYNATKGRYNL